MNGGIAYLKLLMTVDHKHRHPPTHTHTMWGDEYVNYLDLADHSTV